jgi:hypothetical protein
MTVDNRRNIAKFSKVHSVLSLATKDLKGCFSWLWPWGLEMGVKRGNTPGDFGRENYYDILLYDRLW